MKLLRYGPPGGERPGIVDGEGRIRDLSGVVSDIAGDAISPAGLAKIAGVRPESLPLVTGDPRIGACVAGTRNFVCIGLNYADHAAETGATPPKEPIVFLKALTAVCGPNDDVEIPRASVKTDWEVELGIVIGRETRRVAEANALNHVAGYCTFNDVSERSFQLERGGQWDKGKGCDSFGPIGPWLVTKDEIADPQALRLWLDVNGERMQDSSTADMIFSCAEIVSYVSRFMTLLPGDVICTGTPQGVGMGRGRFLAIGDRLRLAVDGLGEQQQTVVAAA